MYVLSLDLSLTNTGIALFDTKDKSLLYSDSFIVTKEKNGKEIKTFQNTYEKIFNYEKVLDEKFKTLEKKYKLTPNNTIIVIEKRLSGFTKSSTNKTIETTAQLHYVVISYFLYKQNYQFIDSVYSITWQNKLLNASKEKKSLKEIISNAEKISINEQNIIHSAKLKEDKKRLKNLSKILSIEFIQNKYNIDTKDDDMADAICIGTYWMENRFFNANSLNLKYIESLKGVLGKKVDDKFLMIDCKENKKHKVSLNDLRDLYKNNSVDILQGYFTKKELL